MNSQSGKLQASRSGKLHLRSSQGAGKLPRGNAENFGRVELSARKITEFEASGIYSARWLQADTPPAQASNFSHLEFPALEIETVENGSIRQ